jgi:hypothetical protein
MSDSLRPGPTGSSRRAIEQFLIRHDPVAPQTAPSTFAESVAYGVWDAAFVHRDSAWALIHHTTYLHSLNGALLSVVFLLCFAPSLDPFPVRPSLPASLLPLFRFSLPPSPSCSPLSPLRSLPHYPESVLVMPHPLLLPTVTWVFLYSGCDALDPTAGSPSSS